MRRWMQYFKSLQWKLITIFTLLIIISAQLIGISFIQSLENYFHNDLIQDLSPQAQLLAQHVKPILEDSLTREEMAQRIQQVMKQLVFLKTKDKTTPMVEIEVLDETGYVIASSNEKSKNIGKKNIRAKVPAGKTETSFIRRDHSTQKDYRIYVKQMKNDKNFVIGTIYIEASLDPTYQTIRGIIKLLLKSTALALFASGVLILLLTRTITHPIKEITKQATAMAAGDFDRKVEVKGEDEIGQLAAAFNDLAAHLREALSKNEEEKEKLETVLANMSDGVLATDHQGNIIVKNRWAEELLGQTIKLGQPIDAVLPLDKPVSIPLFQEEERQIELNVDDPEEHTIIKVTFTPIKGQKREMIGLIAVLNDITEEEKLDRQRKDFVANVSHELRTPLTTIRSYLEALEDGAIKEPELASRFLQVAQQEADRMARLIRDLLQLSRLDSQQAYFEPKIIQPETILEDVLQRFQLPCQQKDIKLRLKINAPLPPVYVDRDQIDQVMDNILSNAIKYTPEQGQILITAQKTKDTHIEISISDTGPGIPKKDATRIFERFYRVDKARSRELGGTGLGLSIAKEIIQSHGGEIWIDTTYTQGAKVCFTLPTKEVKKND